MTIPQQSHMKLLLYCRYNNIIHLSVVHAYVRICVLFFQREKVVVDTILVTDRHGNVSQKALCHATGNVNCTSIKTP